MVKRICSLLPALIAVIVEPQQLPWTNEVRSTGTKSLHAEEDYNREERQKEAIV